MANEPARLPYDAEAVTKSDTTKYKGVVGLYVGTTGDVAVHTAVALDLQETRGTAPTSVVFKAVPAGGVIPLAIGRVLSTGTTASDIVALKA